MSSITNIVFAGMDHYVTSNYGYRTLNGVRAFHYGTDYGTNLKNLPLYAIEKGSVNSKGYAAGGAGHYIWIHYPRIDILVGYFHMREATNLVVGQTVGKGTFVGYTGTTGNSTGIHLHLGIKNKSTGEYYDPEVYAKNYSDPVPMDLIGTPVSRDTSVNQIEIMIDTLHARKRPELNTATIIGLIKKGMYSINATRDMRHEASNGYLWYEVEPSVWIAYSVNWAVLHEANTSVPPAIDDRDIQIAELRDQNIKLKNQNASQLAVLKTIQTIVNEIAV